MLTFPKGLSPAELTAVADLEHRVLAVDGGRLKLEHPTLRARRGERVEDVLAWEGDRLVGFAGTYAWGSGEAEVSGMVDPAARHRGLGGRLLDAALRLCRGPQALLVVPGGSAGGHALARSRGGRPHHSEHGLVLTGPPSPGTGSRALRLRPAVPGDAPAVAALLAAGFGGVAADLEPSAREATADTQVVELDGVAVGSLRVERDGVDAGVYGLVVHPSRQGRGIGRDVLRQVCLRLQADGVTRVSLEVSTDNDRALGLYTSLGFAPVATEDYYGLTCPSPVTT